MSSAASRIAPRSDLRLVPVGVDRWRVISARGRILGQLVVTHAPEARYRVRVFRAADGLFRDVGEFWSADDALECLRLMR